MTASCWEMLMLLGMHTYNDPQLVTELARVVRMQLLYHLPRLGSPATQDAAAQGLQQVLA